LGVDVADLTGERGAAGVAKPQSNLPNKPTVRALVKLKERWKSDPRDRASIKHLVAVLFGNDANDVLAWLDV
jgi:hypothetical protein